MRWEHFEHGADLGVRGHGATLEAAFAAAALAVTAAVTDPSTVRPAQTVELDVTGSDPELLLYDWLNGLIATMATHRSIYSSFEVHIGPGGLHARLRGEPVDVHRHMPAVEPKGATLTALRVAHEPDGEWLAQCIVDV
jgi:SHS2 domain-containing protein